MLVRVAVVTCILALIYWPTTRSPALEDPADPFAAWESGGSRASPSAVSTSIASASSAAVSVVENEAIYRRQQLKAAKTNLTPNEGTRNVWDLFEALWTCRTVQRIGRIGDGGKWVCDPAAIAAASSSSSYSSECVVYSFGSAGEPSFELEAREVLGCVVHSFDPTLDPKTQAHLKALGGVMHFHSVGLGVSPGTRQRLLHFNSSNFGIGVSGRHFGASDQQQRSVGRHDNGFKSLAQIMGALKHSHLSVLKVDIEGSEWDVFNEDVLCRDVATHRHAHRGGGGGGGGGASPTAPTVPFDQLLVELHYRDEGSLFHFMRGVHAHGFRAFRREPNVLNVQRCVEYSFVRVPGLLDGDGDLNAFLEDCRLPDEQKYRKAYEWFAAKAPQLQ